MIITVHTMEYYGELQNTVLAIRNYKNSDYDDYVHLVESSFREMRKFYELPLSGFCNSRDVLMENNANIYIWEANGNMIGAVSLYGQEIDDLVIAEEFQNRGYGKRLLSFAICEMQKREISPIILHVTDWNQKAIHLYEKAGFRIVKTEEVVR